jgi:hypothetical protein
VLNLENSAGKKKLSGLIWCRNESVLYSFVDVLQAAQKQSHNTEQRPLKVFGRLSTAKIIQQMFCSFAI